MKKWFKRITLALLIFVLTAVPTSYSSLSNSEVEKSTTYRVTNVTTQEERTKIVNIGAAIEKIGDDYVEILALPSEAWKLKKEGFKLTSIALDFPPEDSAFLNYKELSDKIQKAAVDYPDIVKKFSIGKSFEGREIWGVKISKNAAVDDYSKPAVLYIGLHHAREHLTTEMTSYLLRLYTEGYGKDKRITDILDNKEVYIVFNLNPDGGEYDLTDDSYQMWRKNRQPNPGSSVGTDLNRNYAYKWGGPGSSGYPYSETYRGKEPFSAPETAALRDFVNSHVKDGKQQIKTSISFHSYSELILYPYGYTSKELPPDMSKEDFNTFKNMAKTMAATNGYTPKKSSDLYVASGDYVDWAYGQHKIFAFTFEMFPKGQFPGFYPPVEAIKRETERNKEASLYIAEQAK